MTNARHLQRRHGRGGPFPTVVPDPPPNPGGGTGGGGGGGTSGLVTSVDGRSRMIRFDPDSWWYWDISEAPLHANTAAFATEFNYQIYSPLGYNNVNMNIGQYTPPIFIATNATPTVKVWKYDLWNENGWVDPFIQDMWLDVPIPVGARHSSGTDREMCIYNKDSDTLWEFWVTVAPNDQYGDGTFAPSSGIIPTNVWRAAHGGRIENCSESIGVHESYSGTAATSIALAEGIIHADELEAGEINHALACAFTAPAEWPNWSWPANRTDGWGDPNTCPWEGQRFRLNPALDPDDYDVNNAAKTIMRCLQKYGGFIRDKSGGTTLYAENFPNEDRGNPYVALLGGEPEWAFLNNLPWHQTQWLPINYGQP